jgi:hypothetical protein
MTVDVPAVPVGFYTVYVNSLGGWTGAITRIGNTTPVARAATPDHGRGHRPHRAPARGRS